MNQRGVAWLFLGLVLFIPFAHVIRHIHPVLGAGKEGFVAGMVAVACAGTLWKSDYRFPLSFGTIWALLFASYALVHVPISSQALSRSVASARLLLLYVVMAGALLLVFRNADAARISRLVTRYMQIAVLSAVLVAWIGIHQKYVNPDFFNFYDETEQNLHSSYLGVENVRIVSTMGNPISLGLFMQVGILFCGYLYMVARRMRARLLIISLIGMLVFASLLTLSRSAFMIMGALGGMLAMRILMYGTGKQRLVLAGTIAAVAVGVYAVFAASQQSDSISMWDLVFNRTMQFDAVSDDPRLLTWTRYMQPLFRRSWIEIAFGMGLGNIGNFKRAFVMENAYLALVYELGIVGLLFFLGLFARMGYVGWKLVKTGREPAFRVLGGVMAYFLLADLLAFTLADSHFNLPMVFYFWCLFALGELALHSQKRSATTHPGLIGDS